MVIFNLLLLLISSQSVGIDVSNFNTAQVNNLESLTRFIKIKSPNTPGKHYLQVSQVACYDATGTNIAKGKPVTASPSHGESNAKFVTDGKTVSRYFPNIYLSSLPTGSYLEIDLLAELLIDRCVIYNRSDCCRKRILGTRVEFQDKHKRTHRYSVINDERVAVEIRYQNMTAIDKHFM